MFDQRTRSVFDPQTTAVSPEAKLFQPLVLSAQAPDSRSKAAATAVICISLAVFLFLVPFAKLKVPAYPVFIPLNQAALVINDLITALLLFMQLRVVRSRAIVVLGCAYLFTALMAIAHLLSFPGVFTPTGLLGAGPQTTAYLFVFWHSGFPIAVMAYSLLKTRPEKPVGRMPRLGAPLVFTSVVAVLLIGMATLGSGSLPPILDGDSYSSEFNVARYGQWGLTALAIVVLWLRRPHSVLDLWLLVSLFASFVEIGLVAIFNGGRYDVGFYAGRVYALLSSVFVLAVLLLEQGRLYSGVFASRLLEHAEAEARASRDVLRLAMAGGRIGAWTLDLDTGKLWVSAELEGALGFSPRSLRTTVRSVVKRLHREDVPRVRQAIARALERDEDFAVEARFCQPQGRWRWFDMRGRARAGGDGRAIVGVAIDVTAQHDVQAALRENDRRKDAFLATLAHELRNPLAPIRYSVEVMARHGALSPQMERVRNVLDSQSRQLSRLVDDLLEVSRITQGKVQLRNASVSVSGILREALDAVFPAAEAAKHEMVVSVVDDQLYAQADAGRLSQVFTNLLNNAIKFTPAGGRITVAAHREGGAAVIRIKDTGIGIEPEHLGSIFGIFSQVQTSVDRSQGGLGIGLALVRGFVELHGGSVRVHSDGAGRGTEFTVTLPLESSTSDRSVASGVVQGRGERAGPEERAFAMHAWQR